VAEPDAIGSAVASFASDSAGCIMVTGIFVDGGIMRRSPEL
jgi:hypothetical protein